MDINSVTQCALQNVKKCCVLSGIRDRDYALNSLKMNKLGSRELGGTSHLFCIRGDIL